MALLTIINVAGYLNEGDADGLPQGEKFEINLEFRINGENLSSCLAGRKTHPTIVPQPRI
jgi:hypothetical protein